MRPSPGLGQEGLCELPAPQSPPQVWPPSTGLRAGCPQVHRLAWPLRSPGCTHSLLTCRAHCRRGSSAPCRPLPTLAPPPTLLCLPRGAIWGEATLLSLPLTPLLVFARCPPGLSPPFLFSVPSSHLLLQEALLGCPLSLRAPSLGASALALPRHLKRVSLRFGWEFSPRVTLASGLEF